MLDKSPSGLFYNNFIGKLKIKQDRLWAIRLEIVYFVPLKT